MRKNRDLEFEIFWEETVRVDDSKSGVKTIYFVSRWRVTADCEDGDSLQSLVIGSVDMDLDQDGATRRTTRWITWELRTLRVITTRMWSWQNCKEELDWSGAENWSTTKHPPSDRRFRGNFGGNGFFSWKTASGIPKFFLRPPELERRKKRRTHRGWLLVYRLWPSRMTRSEIEEAMKATVMLM